MLALDLGTLAPDARAKRWRERLRVAHGRLLVTYRACPSAAMLDEQCRPLWHAEQAEAAIKRYLLNPSEHTASACERAIRRAEREAERYLAKAAAYACDRARAHLDPFFRLTPGTVAEALQRIVSLVAFPLSLPRLSWVDQQASNPHPALHDGVAASPPPPGNQVLLRIPSTSPNAPAL